MAVEYKTKCNTSCPFFPRVGPVVEWEFDENGIKRRKIRTPLLCDWDHKPITSWDECRRQDYLDSKKKTWDDED